MTKGFGCVVYVCVIVGILFAVIFDDHTFSGEDGAKGCDSNGSVSYTISSPESYKFSCEKKDGKQYIQFVSESEQRIIGVAQVNVDNSPKNQLDINFDVVDVFDVVLDPMESCYLSHDPTQSIESPYTLEVTSVTDLEVTCTNTDENISITAFIQLRPFSQVSN